MADPVIKANIGLSSTTDSSGGQYSFGPQDSSFSAIVKDILLFDQYRKEFFKDVDPSLNTSTYPIGTVKFQRVYSNIYSNDFYDLAIPKKLYNTIYPKRGEMVKVHFIETYDAQSEKGTMFRIYMYSDIVSAWNNIEHNIIPKNSLFSLNKEKTDLNSYRLSQDGNSINKQNQSPYDFKELGNIKGLYPMNDYLLQGRGGNTIRLGTSYGSTENVPWKGDEGNPLIVFRNRQNNQTADSSSNIFEDINKDGSSLYMMSGQKIGFTVACDNFDSFNVNIDNTTKKDIIVPKKAQVTDDQVETFEAPTTDLPPVTQSILQPQLPTTSSADQDMVMLDQATDSEYEIMSDTTLYVPATNGIYADIVKKSSSKYVRYVGGTSSNSKDYTGQMGAVSMKLKSIESCIGHVSPVKNMPASVKALLDVIAIMESTAQYGDFNGYDVYFKHLKLKGYDSYDSNPIHPNIKIQFGDKGDTTSAAGRYQFLYDTWVSYMGATTGMSKANQDYAGWKRMLANTSQQKIDNIGESNFDAFKLVVGGQNIPGKEGKGDPNCLAGIWASLPSTYGGASGYYGQNVSNRKSFEQLFTIYKMAYQKYK